MSKQECKCCGRLQHVKRRRTNTAYADDEENWLTSCLECFEEREEYWKERWGDYYNGVLA